MGEAPAAYKVVLMKCWEDASLADRNDWSLPVATGRKDRGAAAEGNQGRQKYQGRLDPPQTEQQGAAAEAGPGHGQQTLHSDTRDLPLRRALGEMEERERVP